MHAPEVEIAGVGFTEGPSVAADGRLYVTSMADGTVAETRDGAILARHHLGGGPTGTAVAAGGAVYVVQCSGLFGAPSATAAGLYVIDDGVVRAMRTEGLRAPNDICFGPDGHLYFTDPADDPTQTGPLPAPVCAYDLAAGALRTVADGILFPNGLAFAPGGDALLVAESLTGRVLRYPWAGGVLGEPDVACELGGDGPPDGLAFDDEGNLWVAAPQADAVVAFDPGGAEVERVPCGPRSFPTNCCFGGPDRATLYITVAKTGGVLRLRPGVRGLRLHG